MGLVISKLVGVIMRKEAVLVAEEAVNNAFLFAYQKRTNVFCSLSASNLLLAFRSKRPRTAFCPSDITTTPHGCSNPPFHAPGHPRHECRNLGEAVQTSSVGREDSLRDLPEALRLPPPKTRKRLVWVTCSARIGTCATVLRERLL